MIAVVRWIRDGEARTATLGDDARWTVPHDPELAEMLDDTASRVDHRPQLGDAWARHAHEVARTFGGTAEVFPDPAAPPPGTVF